MTQRVLAVLFSLFLMPFGVARSRAQSSDAVQTPAPAASSVPAHGILTKDPEYTMLLTPPSDNNFLETYSAGYREKKKEIEAKVADISDPNLRGEARKNEWAGVSQRDLDRFKYEADVAFREAKIAFLQRHADGLFEIGRFAYDENNHSLVVTSDPLAPIDANFRVVINPATLNQVYDKFHDIVSQEIDQKAHEYVSKAEAGSTCGRNPDLCFTFEKNEVEQRLRAERIVVVAGGDLAKSRIDRLFLADYESESVLLDLSPNISSLNNAPWRFAVGDVPVMPAEAASTESQIQAGQNTESAPGGNTGESTSNATASSGPPPNRVRIPDEVAASSIISQLQPQYPPAAREGHIQGSVVLHAMIDKEGNISDVQVLSGDEVLAQAAVEAVRQWRYKPILIDGEPAEVETTITITFSLGE